MSKKTKTNTIIDGHIITMLKKDGETRTIDTTPAIPPVPKGAWEYFFREDGKFFMEKDDTIVFSCIARTKEAAIKKFDRWNLEINNIIPGVSPTFLK